MILDYSKRERGEGALQNTTRTPLKPQVRNAPFVSVQPMGPALRWGSGKLSYRRCLAVIRNWHYFSCRDYILF